MNENLKRKSEAEDYSVSSKRTSNNVSTRIQDIIDNLANVDRKLNNNGLKEKLDNMRSKMNEIKNQGEKIFIGFFGRSEAGKSTLINKIIGYELLHHSAAKEVSCTKFPTKCYFHEENSYEIFQYDKNDAVIKKHSKLNLSETKNLLAKINTEINDKVYYTVVTIPLSSVKNDCVHFLKNIVFIDLIGVPAFDLDNAYEKNYHSIKNNLDALFIIKRDARGYIYEEDIVEIYKCRLFEHAFNTQTSFMMKPPQIFSAFVSDEPDTGFDKIRLSIVYSLSEFFDIPIERSDLINGLLPEVVRMLNKQKEAQKESFFAREKKRIENE